MSTTVKYKSRTRELTANGWVDVVVHQGSKADVDDFAASHYINEPGENGGYLKTVRVLQDEADIWNCELRYEQGTDGGFVQSPPTAYGKKSAVLHCGMLSIALKNHPDYLANWDHHLAAAPGVNTVPSWWATAKKLSISGTDAQKYAWIRDVSQLPSDAKGRWHLIKEADEEFDGTEHYDYSTYSVTERARFRSAAAAGKMVAQKLNRIGTPMETFGLTSGNWKCDAAEVNWSGKYWYATLTWTLSGNSRGWNRRIYKD